MKKVFITGASGFIGSHLAEKLVLLGYQVKVLVPYNVENSWGWLDTVDKKIKKNLEVILGDICDQDLIFRSVKGCDIIFHLAALISIQYSYVSPSSYVSTNINGTLNLLNSLKNNDNIELMINTSTSEVYGTSQYSPIDEKHPLNAQSPYAATKISADQMSLSYNKSFDLPISVIRPFNTFGPRQSLRASIPTIVLQALDKKSEIKLGNLKPKRDFTYVDDIVNGFISCINNKKCIGEVINLGTGFDFSIEQIVNYVQDLIGYKIKVKVEKERFRPAKSEVDHLLAENIKAKNILKWEPKYVGENGLKEGLKKTISWFKEEKNVKFYKSFQYNL